MKKRKEPYIGITVDVQIPPEGLEAYEMLCDHRYPEAVRDAGGFPVLLPIARTPRAIRKSLDGLDGLVIVGGDDVDPRLYGETARPGTGEVFAPRLVFERRLYRFAKRRRLPILAICYGMQLVNVLEGGTLYQDIGRDAKSPVDHRDPDRPLQSIRIMKGSRLRKALGAARIVGHCFHHQAVKRLAPGFRAVAFAKDGLVEAVEDEREEILCVQWHPERTRDSRATQRLFRRFVELCGG